jgi:hypothetical protein
MQYSRPPATGMKQAMKQSFFVGTGGHHDSTKENTSTDFESSIRYQENEKSGQS